MTVAELTLTDHPRGRRASALEVSVIGPVEASDLALLAGSRGVQASPIKRLRDRHLGLARCLAAGMSDTEAALITGYDPARISVLKADPTFKQAMAEFKTMKDAAFADFQERAAVVTLEALNQIQEELEEDAEREEKIIPIGQKLAIVEKLADRTGHAPVVKSVQVNATVDLTDRLARARERVQGAKVVGGTST